ncbi:ATP-dependent sacrificial sulfur transferase LarE [Methanospirillum sp.]
MHNTDINKKILDLKRIIREHAPLLISYSGGVDSTLLAVLTRETIGAENMHCVLVDGPEVPRRAITAAINQSEYLKIPLTVREGVPFSTELQRTNPHDRCRHCKLGTYTVLRQIADEIGCKYIADGANASDLGEHRPGIEAFSSCGVIHPFIMAGITKQDIREIACQMELPFWDKPSSACLYSRIPYGEEITDEKLRMIEKGEELLCDIGIRQARVRHHGSIARIEVLPEEMEKIIAHREQIHSFFKNLGFSYITLDLKGYRSGSMDEVLGPSS